MKVSIGAQGARGETSQFKETDQQPELYLIEAFINVCAAPTDLLALQFGILELQVDNVPCIFGSKRSSSACKEVVGLPRLDPSRRAPQSGDTPDAVANRQQS